jgi:hypothetical protein
MGVHFEVAVASQVQVRGGMLGEERQHVIEERDARLDFALARAVDVESQHDFSFPGCPIYFSPTRIHLPY